MMVLYRSKTVSPLEANPTKYRAGMLSPLEANPTKYRSQVVSTLLEATWPPPSGPYLIGWYKFDEESGIAVYNHADDGISGGGTLPHLIVNNPDGDWWTYLSGFGSTPRRTGSPNGMAYGAYTSRTFSVSGKFTFGSFFRYMTPLTSSTCMKFSMGSLFRYIMSGGNLTFDMYT